jgi:hypothetical protein
LSGAECVAEAASERASQASLAWEWYWGALVVDYLVLGSVAEAVRGESGAQAAGSGALYVAAGWSLLCAE